MVSMKYLGVNQHVETKLPVSEFDGLQELLESHWGIRHVKTTSRYTRSYYTPGKSTWEGARQSTSGGNLHSSCEIAGHRWSDSLYYVSQVFYTLDVGWWSPSYTLCSAQATIEVKDEATLGTAAVDFYLLGFLNDFTSFVPWNTLVTANGYQELGMLQYPAAPTNATVARPFANGSVIYLSIPVTNRLGMKSLLDSAVTSNSNLLRLTAVHQYLRDGTTPPGSMNNRFINAFRCTLDVYYWS